MTERTRKVLSGAVILFTILVEGDQRRQTSKINKGAAVYIVYYLNGPYTQKLESPYKDPSSTFGSERVKLLKLSSHHYNSKKMVHFYYVGLYSGIESISRPLFEQVTRMKMDGNFKKIWPTSIILQGLRLKKPPKVYHGYCSLMKFV